MAKLSSTIIHMPDDRLDKLATIDSTSSISKRISRHRGSPIYDQEVVHHANQRQKSQRQKWECSHFNESSCIIILRSLQEKALFITLRVLYPPASLSRYPRINHLRRAPVVDLWYKPPTFRHKSLSDIPYRTGRNLARFLRRLNRRLANKLHHSALSPIHLYKHDQVRLSGVSSLKIVSCCIDW